MMGRMIAVASQFPEGLIAQLTPSIIPSDFNDYAA